MELGVGSNGVWRNDQEQGARIRKQGVGSREQEVGS